MNVRTLASAVAIAAAAVLPARSLPAQSASPAGAREAYPSRPEPMPEAEEIALARTAAPAEVSGQATIWVLRASGPAKAVAGTNGCTCMVSRDLHKGSVYPICYDREATRTTFPREMLELRLRFAGKSEPEVKAAVAAAHADGTLPRADRPSVVYMMSSRQVLYSSPDAEGRRVGAWHPHVMIAMPGATGEQLGFGADGSAGNLSLDHPGEPSAQLIVPVTWWADSAKAGE